jgi:hypothetical protein
MNGNNGVKQVRQIESCLSERVDKFRAGDDQRDAGQQLIGQLEKPVQIISAGGFEVHKEIVGIPLYPDPGYQDRPY